LIRIVSLGLFLAGLVGCASTPPSEMTQAKLAEQIERIAGEVKVTNHVIEFSYNGVQMACISDTTHDRMRLITPVANGEALGAADLQVLMIANFHTTLDARYALSKGVVYATFLHPLSPLTTEELESALRQVSALARNFGSSFSSDELVYGVETETEL